MADIHQHDNTTKYNGNGGATEVCENCGRAIGRLETPHLFDGHVVCPACDARLRADAPPVTPAPPRPAIPLDYGRYDRSGNEYDHGYDGCPRRRPPPDTLFGVRLLCLILGLFWWPLLLVWLMLGVYRLIEKAKAGRDA